MSRSMRYLIGPELVMLIVIPVVYAICARHPSGEGHDVSVLEKLLMVLPPIATALVFLTILTPGAANWWWLGRALSASFIGVGIFSMRILHGFGAGAKGQDAGFILAMTSTGAVASLGAAIAGAVILTRSYPSIGDWFRTHRFAGSALTLLATLPIGAALFFVVATGIGVAAGLWSSFRR